MTRRKYCELILRQIYNGQPSDDSSITVNLVNIWLNGGIANAVKANWVEAIKLDGIAYINNGFYSTFTLDIEQSDEDFIYTTLLPQIPYALGKTEGISTVRFKKDKQLSDPAIPLSQNQWGYRNGTRKIPNKTLYCQEGLSLKIESVLPLWEYDAVVTMVSAGDSTNLDAELNLPEDYFALIVAYCKEQLMQERMAPKDIQNDGQDGPIKST